MPETVPDVVEVALSEPVDVLLFESVLESEFEPEDEAAELVCDEEPPEVVAPGVALPAEVVASVGRLAMMRVSGRCSNSGGDGKMSSRTATGNVKKG